METVILIVHGLIAAALIGLVLLQQGKGADMGAAFGSGASQTVFGARGSGNFLSRTTAILAALFFVTSLSLAYMAGQGAEGTSVTEQHAAPEPVKPVVTETVPSDVPSIPQPEGAAPLPPE